ncbi:hypothetical protein CTEN210_13430 [Chaetoceros tenuissimus]|uniref:Leucine-rich repeat domain-containing protein n=1 Tax=Chaetoceros tenuissimus TaxID=426638 RepID=A0AAD3D6M1_9STRA|nr:hypothetical protein CTEN210_13430 [Chaetoceros tenuissimus]
MRLLRKLTKREWKEISEKYKDGGVHMYRGKRTLFYKGEILYKFETGEYLIYDKDERESWEVIIVLPGVEVIHHGTFNECRNIETVIMADTVKRIENEAFDSCLNLKFVKLSRNLEFIGTNTFWYCKSLTSVFIPASCREIGDWAFYNCKRLLILVLPPYTQLGEDVFESTALMKRSPFETDENGDYDRNDDNEEETVDQWIKSINNEEAYVLHRACSSFNPSSENIHALVKRQGIELMRMKNTIGVTPSQYLEANKFAEISEKDIINRYISEMMGEVF